MLYQEQDTELGKMAYDPYSQMNEQPKMGPSAAEALNPVNWVIWKYKYDPRAYSFNKGLWMPFGKGIARDNMLKNIPRIGEYYKASRAAGDSMYKIGSNMAKKGIGGNWFLGEKFLENSVARESMKRSLNSNLGTVANEMLAGSTLNLGKKHRVSKAISTYLGEALEQEGSVTGVLTQKAVEERLIGLGGKKVGMADDAWKASVNKFMSGDRLQKAVNLSGPEKFIGQLGTTGFKRRAAWRGAMLLGKGIAIGATLWGVYDMAKMVAEPVGRYIVDNANRVASAYANRYMPEMGGKIALSYMSSGAATERQRAVEAISRSYINGRSAIGQEASFAHDF
jgi:hypothetical protein